VKKIIFIFFIFTSLSHAIEVTCNFEEVYANSDIQQGIFLLKNKKLRYEYYDRELFTIIAKNENFYLIHRAHKNNVQKIQDNTEILDMFMKISSDFPNIKNYYEIESIKVKVEKDSYNFIKRISINSEKVNVSVNIMNCKYENINNKYFKLFDFQNLKLK
tara:strand:- start:3383 stop:3862 length:480 start_codon:yes stop_codon:yes gene_type:complete